MTVYVSSRINTCVNIFVAIDLTIIGYRLSIASAIITLMTNIDAIDNIIIVYIFIIDVLFYECLFYECLFYEIYVYYMNLAKIAIESGLNYNMNNYGKHLSEIPENTFGVFVSVKRSKYHKLDEWPEEIHGCIGYWDSRYQNIKNSIPKHIIDVSHSATWDDSRRTYFDKSIYIDIMATYEVDLMLTVGKINNKLDIS